MRATLFLLLIALSIPISADDPIDTATTIRNTVLRAQPTQSSAVVANLNANAALNVFERERLWVAVAPVGEAESATGWLRFTELRIGGPARTGPATAPAPERGGFAGFSRSVSGFLRGFRGRDQRAQRTTSTIGIRGLTVADLEAAHPDVNALALVDRYSTSKADAEQFAGVGGLAARTVSVPGGQP